MGNALQSHGINLSAEVSNSLSSYTSLTSVKCKEIYEAFAIKANTDFKLPPHKVCKILRPFFDKSKALVDAFTLETGSQSEDNVNVYYLLVALSFYSKSNIMVKARCNLHTVIFSIFLQKDSRTLKLQELTKLIKSVIMGVCCMTECHFPDNRSFRNLADIVMMIADYNLIKRVNLEEYHIYRFTSFIKRDETLMHILSKHELVINIADQSSINFQQQNNSFQSLPSFTLNSGQRASRSLRTRSVVHSVKFPSLVSPRVASNYSPHEKVIYDAYYEVLKSKHKVTEKSNYYLDLSYYLINQCKHKPIFMARTDWSNKSISLEEAIETFKSYFDYLEGFITRSYRKKETVKHNEIEVYARLFEKGDTERIGWDKSDVFDIIGKNSSANAYYLIEKYGITRNNRLQFGEFLRSCLPDHKKFDESNVNRYYSAVIKEENTYT